MESLLNIVADLKHVLPSYLLNPLVYIFLVLIFMQYRRQALFERRLFHVRIYSPWQHFLQSLVYGLAGGILVSLLTVGLGISIRPADMWMIGALTLILSFLQLQYLCFAYAGGLLGLLALLAGLLPDGTSLFGLDWLLSLLHGVNVAGIAALAGVLHLAEGLFVRAAGGRRASPIIIHGRRGMLLGAYQWQRFWVLPLFAVSGPAAAAHLSLPFDWWPLWGGQAGAAGLLLLPCVIGFTDLSIATFPGDKSARSSKRLLVYGLVLLILAFGARYSAALQWVAVIFAVLGHEALIRLGRLREENRKPLFVQRGTGVTVLAVLEQSPAAELGIRAGDVIMKINGREVFREVDLYPALQLHSTFCKMEVLNHEGNIKYLQRPIYQGEHHQLGLITAPDENTQYYVDLKPVNLVQLMNQQIDRGL